MSPFQLQGRYRGDKALANSSKKWWLDAVGIARSVVPGGELVHGDALAFLSALKPDIADVIVLDPPFNLGKRYGKSAPTKDRLAEEAYIAFISSILQQSVRVLKPGGALWLYHIPRRALTFGSTLSQELSLQHWIAVAMKNGFARGPRLYPAHYALLHFTKGVPQTLRRPKISPLCCPHCGEYVRDYGGYAEHIQSGVNLSDVWDDISPVRHQKYKTRSANELPMTIARRVMLISGIKRGLLVDPFAGSGTFLVAGRIAGMSLLGCDREAENISLIASRLEGLSAKQPPRSIA